MLNGEKEQKRSVHFFALMLALSLCMHTALCIFFYYQILTKVAVPWLPIVGMSMQSVSGLDQVHWLGLGPYDAYPNKQAAPILGVWGGTAGSPDVTGIKAMRWMERSGSEGTIHVSNSGYMENDAMCPERTYILSGVFGRPEKGRRAEE